jgi:regulatory protein
MSDDGDSLPVLTEAALHDAAVAYLARYSATRATLTRVLNRRVDRWARLNEGADIAAQVAAARRAVRDVVARLTTTGAVDDASFAAARSRGLLRSGHSRRATQAHLAARGVPAELLAAAVPDDADTELQAAVALARRRRFGPFRAEGPGPDAQERRRELAALARAGFARETAERALAMAPEDAAAVLARLRRD